MGEGISRHIDMRQQFAFSYVDPMSGVNTVVSVDWDSAELQILEEYSRCAELLIQTRFFAERYSGSFSIDFQTRGTKPIVQTQLPEADLIAAAFHRLRPIQLQKEAANFMAVSNLVNRKVADRFTRAIIAHNRAIFRSDRLRKNIRMTSNGEDLVSEDMFVKWVNAFEYHRDDDKKRSIEALHKIIPLSLTQTVVVQMLSEKCVAVSGLLELIRLLLGRSQGVQFQVPVALI